jgi:LPS-assembly lipoprotein
MVEFWNIGVWKKGRGFCVRYRSAIPEFYNSKVLQFRSSTIPIFQNSRILLLCTLLTLPACGFHPLYATPSAEQRASLTHIEVVQPPGRLGQLFAIALTDALPPRAGKPLYRLEPAIEKQLQPVVVRKDGRISRYDTVMLVTLVLKDSNGKEVMRDVVRSYSGYNVLDADFASFIAERDASRRAVEQAANDTVQRLAIKLAELP